MNLKDLPIPVSLPIVASDFKRDLVQLVNSYDLPAFVKADKLLQVYTELSRLADEELSACVNHAKSRQESQQSTSNEAPHEPSPETPITEDVTSNDIEVIPN